jgi:hypothetical protein
MLKKLTLLCTFVSSILFSQEIDLKPYEASLYSQNGEDGVLAKIFELIGTSSRYCVEFGAYDGITGSNTCLLRKQGWSALLLDRRSDSPEIHKEFITAENITSLFDKYKVPKNLDLVSIDIDYNDFYVWQALDPKYQPKVVLIEYNSALLPDQDKVAKPMPYYSGDGTIYYGASILALYNLGRSKGYSLVYAEKAGVNLFFIRDDVLKEKNLQFKDVNNVEKLYQKPTAIHREDSKNRVFLSSAELL